MLIHHVWDWIAQKSFILLLWKQYNEPIPDPVCQAATTFASLDIRFDTNWHTLGPFQIGTREAAWGADPLEFHGGFHSLTPLDPKRTFRSSLGRNGSVTWTQHISKTCRDGSPKGCVRLEVGFPEIDWAFLRSIYGWASLQWQGWTRGTAEIHSTEDETILIYTRGIVELWIDDERHFGGDLFQFNRAPILLHLKKGTRRLNFDIRLVRDVRSMGGSGTSTVDIELDLRRSLAGLAGNEALVPDAITDSIVPLTGGLASVSVRNDDPFDLSIVSLEADHASCTATLLTSAASPTLTLRSGQSWSLAFQLWCPCTAEEIGQISVSIVYRSQIDCKEGRLTITARPQVRHLHDLQKLSFMHPAGVVSYALMKPPPVHCPREKDLPIILILHGAGVEVDSELMRSAIDDLPSLCAWKLVPTGGTTWSGDDWHQWGLADIEAAIHSIKDWIATVKWQNSGVKLNRWIVLGHSNGGQGVWYILTHRPDNILAVAALSGYSSIQNYVPYTFWRSHDPARFGIIQSALLSYAHETLLANAEGIAVLEQHGSEDDNVPPYHSRLLGLRLSEEGIHSEYHEFAGRSHWWTGILATPQLVSFVEQHLNSIAHERETAPPFTVVSPNSGDMRAKNGISVRHLIVPGRLGRLQFFQEASNLSCSIDTHNVEAFELANRYRSCAGLMIDGQQISHVDENALRFVRRRSGLWQIFPHHEVKSARSVNQLGSIDSVLRTREPFVILQCSNETDKAALQVSRNLFQYFAANSVLSRDRHAARAGSNGNVIHLAVGDDMVNGLTSSKHAFRFRDGHIEIKDASGDIFRHSFSDGVGAIFLQGLGDDRLELVIWGSDIASLEFGARLMPIMTGTGQPDFIVYDQTMAWRGAEGALALGFLDRHWGASVASVIG